MRKSEIIKAYKDYLKKTVDFVERKLEVDEYVDGTQLYSLVDSEGNVVHGGYTKITDLGINGFLCSQKDNMYDKLVHYSSEGDKISSSDLYDDYELFDDYFRACNSENQNGEEYFDYITGKFFVPYSAECEIKFNYNRDAEILLAEVTEKSTGKSYFKYFNRNCTGFCFDDAAFEYATTFRDGVATVKRGGLYYTINEKGEILFDRAFVFLGAYENGVAPFSNDGKVFGFINTKGDIIVEPKYKGATNFKEGVARINSSMFFKSANQCIDLSGNLVKTVSGNHLKMIVEKDGYRFFDDYSNTYMNVKNPVIKDLEGFILCDAPEGLESIDKIDFTSKVIVNGVYDRDSIVVIDNLLLVGDRKFYLDNANGNIVDITQFVDLEDFYSIRDFINGNTVLLSFDEFKERESYRAKMDTDKARETEARQTEERLNGVISSKTVHDKIVELKRVIESEKADTREQLAYLEKKLINLDKKGLHELRIDNDILFVEVDEHLEVNPDLINDLAFIDLASVDFTNIKVSGLNLSKSNAAIDPQTVYNKDLSNGIYDGVRFISMDFDGVKVQNSSFENCGINPVLFALTASESSEVEDEVVEMANDVIESESIEEVVENTSNSDEIIDQVIEEDNTLENDDVEVVDEDVIGSDLEVREFDNNEESIEEAVNRFTEENSIEDEEVIGNDTFTFDDVPQNINLDVNDESIESDEIEDEEVM